MKMKTDNDFGSVLRTIRLRKRLTMKEVAERMQIRETTYRKYETNELTPKDSTKAAIAKALEVSPSLLLADWSPCASSAIGNLISYYEAFGGSFVEKDGHISIRFEALEPFIRLWAEKHNGSAADYASAASSTKKSAVIDSYFDFLVGTDGSYLCQVSSKDSNPPTMQEAVTLTLTAPPHLYSRKNKPSAARP